MMNARLIVAVAVLSAGCSCKPKEQPPDPKQEAEGLYLQAQSVYLKGDFKQAHELFGKVRKLNPSDPRLPAAEGEVYLREVKLSDALQQFQEAAKLDPNRATTWSRIGYIQQLLGDNENASVSLEKALKLNPKDYNALEARAELDLRAGDVDAAVKHLGIAADAAPKQEAAEVVERISEELTKRDRWRDALGILEARVDAGTVSPEIWNDLGDKLVQAERFAEAAAAYETAAKLNPKDPTLWELVGELRVKLDQLPEAQAAYAESLKIKDRGVVHVALARMCQKKKDDACLKAELDKALTTSSGEELRETLDLAELLYSVGRKPDALRLVEAAGEEPELRDDWAWQLKISQWEKEQGDKNRAKAACDLAREVDAGIKKCP
jgi:tetratricopeptide (TPR) repeat protein